MAPKKSTNTFYVFASGELDSENHAIVNAVADEIKRNNLGAISSLKIPCMNVGTLDTMLKLSEEIVTLDKRIYKNVRKVVDFYNGVLDVQSELKQSSATSAVKTKGLVFYGKDIKTYITEFSWDAVRYNPSDTLVSIVGSISKDVQGIESLVSSTYTRYNQARSDLSLATRKYSGTLVTRSLNDLVKKENIVLNSEYLETLMVVTRKVCAQEWTKGYEKLCDMVVPGTSALISSDDEYNLYGVTVFRKKRDEFVKNATLKGYIIRDFTWDVKSIARDKREEIEFSETELSLRKSFIKALEASFRELIYFYLHVKSMLLFVESVLRYGPPVSSKHFEPVLVQARNESAIPKIKAILETRFSTRSSIKQTKYYEKHKKLLTKEGIVVEMSEMEQSIISLTTLESFV